MNLVRWRRSTGKTSPTKVCRAAQQESDKFATLTEIRRRRSEQSLILRVVRMTLENGCSVVRL